MSLHFVEFVHKSFLFIKVLIGLGTSNSIGAQAEETGFTFRFCFSRVSCLLELFNITFSDALCSLF